MRNSHPFLKLLLITASATLSPSDLIAQTVNSVSGNKVCKLYAARGSVVRWVGEGCIWTAFESRPMQPGELMQLTVMSNEKDFVVQHAIKSHDQIIDGMERYPNASVTEVAVCSQGAASGRQVLVPQSTGGAFVHGYARCGGHLISFQGQTKSGEGPDLPQLMSDTVGKSVFLLSPP